MLIIVANAAAIMLCSVNFLLVGTFTQLLLLQLNFAGID